MKTFVCNTLIMKIGKYLQYMIYEKMKMFAICKLWEQEMIFLQYMKYEKKKSKQIKKIGKYLFAIHELWERENICLQYMNYENMEMSVCNTWIMKIFVCYTFTKTWQ